ncbi:FliI/YscN family ATPase [Pseudomethylobacillus aquaticus]|uniref:FliI/YscN family ATPase n=1 Tax=Pseudomethylobacillus aquaticus TaxID=2676064 RepID=A0A3N0UZN6_9PROT|nr:FliI/YscN family ATPase [Pseudomethylobacillus aquaticus]ROH85905.1 FliI/YscN family ATPase [Pseudomethylobacillus aquaticus]
MLSRHNVDWPRAVAHLQRKSLYRSAGRVTKISSLVVEASGVRGLVGDLCTIQNGKHRTADCMAEIVGFRDKTTLLMPYGETKGLGLDSEVVALGSAATIKVCNQYLGRVIDPFGKPLDGRPLEATDQVPLRGGCHNPLNRKRITEVLETGVRVIDTFLPLGKGQRIGIFAGSGVGKTTLLGMIARHTKADINVIALIGERGREVRDFIDKALQADTLSRSVIVVATSDQPALVRELAAHTATAIAEYFCAKQKEVLLIMDSVTRFAMAHREIGLAVGEPATARGYTPSAFGALPKLLERAGNFEGRGSITGIYTVLVEGDDMHEPVSDHMRAILDGHIVLSRDLANHGHYPAINTLASISRLASDLWSKDQQQLITKILRLLSVRERHKDMIEIGAYRAGSNPEVDHAIALYAALESFLIQSQDDIKPRAQLFQKLTELLAKYVG